MGKINPGVRVRVPASTANLGPGFDSLGLALDLYTWVEMSRSEGKTTFQLYGEELEGKGIPLDKSNLIYQVAQQVFARAGVEVPELSVSMYSDIPLARGLGSSASAIVAALTAANALIGSPLSDDELFQLASSIEKHPDNVGASLFGGLVVAYWDGIRAEHIKVAPDERLEVLVAVPDFQLSTEKARHALPKEVAMSDAVFNVGHSNLLVAALCTGRLEMIRLAMTDKLHQPYRSALVPGMAEILEGAADHGALGIALSGAGPTMLALSDRDGGRKEELERFLREMFGRHGIGVETRWLKPDTEGPRVEVLTETAGSGTFMQNLKGEIRT
ncbi:homoserine kinase [Gorillibacterium sp. sgz5001074]|uniref:homoserine kinase n=1 Tax=Gorillibacterium sp. sgz5001074 TaxID=3446695 RepID=UPI003F67C114